MCRIYFFMDSDSEQCLEHEVIAPPVEDSTHVGVRF